MKVDVSFLLSPTVNVSESLLSTVTDSESLSSAVTVETTSRRDGEYEPGGRSGIRQASGMRRIGDGLKGWSEAGVLWESSSNGTRPFDGANLWESPLNGTRPLKVRIWIQTGQGRYLNTWTPNLHSSEMEAGV